MNNSHAEVMLLDGDEASETTLWSKARGPRTGIIADYKEKIQNFYIRK